MTPVGLLIVSHSARLAEGVVEVAAQMAAGVPLVAAGGTDDGGVGTSFEKVMEGIVAADTGEGVVVLTDLGSAVMTAESVLEFLDDEQRAKVRIADAALVEGAVAAAVASKAGAGLEGVARAAEEAVHGAEAEEAPELTEPTESAVLTLTNPLGLHARPAAILAGRLSAFDTAVTVNGVDGQSVMALMALGAGQGEQLVVEASGPDAAQALAFVREQVEAGFGEH
ncbi:PTS sugar transporter subunit IIA [Sinomonas atrocyanea]|uniref:Phosphocarrier protein HPr n=1 Tax=Sinomonas atrocyanea TaxID=37927 RepID=A0A126ZV02_9MICC|nr:dihydroxyacetone kinase phosphoryl donor subunit DhaM [Sinomonas atrocyanea]AMM30988.1 PTS sugar transporter subunit IIA [Sinomonas atrocyanea]GEB63228.1 PTS sugar transporter subunit IIA [Sinomonas atrocyanea]GGG77322.1 PTS sugar transporter subunit IIA [Sinomonas atrocyanea]